MSRGLIVDLFAGGGGASAGIEAALGRPVDIAINHDAVALAVHKANHPGTRHLEADIWEVRPAEATGGRPVELLWASPDCTHFSVAKGDVPRRQDIRSLAWAVVRWAAAVRPAVIILENVSEFRTWGPLGKDGRPVKRRMGVTFLRWKGKLERLGYRVEFTILDAAEYGAPTRRRRLFIVARRDGHGEREGQAARVPHVDKPLGTVVAGGQKHAQVSAFLVKHFGGVVGIPATQPTSTVTATDHHALAAATLVQFNHNNVPVDVERPLPTVVSNNHVAEVRAFLTAFYGQDGTKGKGQSLREPTRTVTAKHRLGLVTVEGTEYQIVDIGMRMLEPHELLRAQFGRFADAYDLSAARTKAGMVRLIGNSVCPEVAEAVVAANLQPGAAREDVA